MKPNPEKFIPIVGTDTIKKTANNLQLKSLNLNKRLKKLNDFLPVFVEGGEERLKN